MRYKIENVIIIGIIPGPHEPKKHLNTYLGPLIAEFKELSTGQWFMTAIGRQFIRCVLVGLSSDIPASRKVAGFTGHSSTKACSRCLKSFHKVGDKIDYSGFERDSWPLRNHFVQSQEGINALNAETKEARKEIEKKFGARYSVLYEIDYYDSIRFSIIDIMHNLFLGTSKHVMAIWKENGYLTTNHFAAMQDQIRKMNVPMDVGRIPYKLESSMAKLTADEWKNWTCVYSLFVLHNILPKEHVECWWLFVQACILICQPIITPESIRRIDQYLLNFCGSFEQLYGRNACTINLHLHLHLVECLRDYGPAHDTWCFSFERYNGILGMIPSNKQSLQIEKTLITRFVQRMEASKNHPNFGNELEDFFPSTDAGALGETQVNSNTYLKQNHFSTSQDATELFFDNSLIETAGPKTLYVLPSNEFHTLRQMYEFLFMNSNYCIHHFGSLCYKFIRIKFGNHLLSSKLARSDRSSYIYAKWPVDNADNGSYRAGRIEFFLKHDIVLKKGEDEILIQPMLAFVSWYKMHPEINYFLTPVSLWSTDFEPMNTASFIPVNRIAARCAQAQIHFECIERPYNNGQAIVIIPIGHASC